ncbi:MAG: hypothetical protein FWE06_01020 [Oscillospiraceae bacterium]|nr:hypothetical protein [Oscillospiraceae bacterium]
MKDNLQYREELIAGNFQIREENSAFAVYQKSSYFSDSFNPQGEWVNTWNCCATYKTLNNAEKYLEKQIACQFPKGYDISGVLNAIELITEEKEIDAPDSMHYKSKPAESLPDGWHWREYDDGSGALDAPDGKSYFSYDRMTNEYRHPNLQGWSTMGDYQQFKTMAAQWVRDNVVDRGDIAPKSQSSLADRCQAAKEASAKQDNNTPQGGKQHEPNR